MAALLAGLPVEVPGATVNRLCGSGLEAVAAAARAIASGDAQFLLAGGVESMSRAPFVMPKAAEPFSRQAEIHDTTIGWRFVNPLMKARYGTDAMPETAENLAAEMQISRADQDAYAYRSQQRTAAAQAAGVIAAEIVAVPVKKGRGDPVLVDKDEHPRADTTPEMLAKLNLFCFGQVRSSYGGGRFKTDLEEAFPGEPRIITSDIRDKDEIYEAIKKFLGKGL